MTLLYHGLYKHSPLKPIPWESLDKSQRLCWNISIMHKTITSFRLLVTWKYAEELLWHTIVHLKSPKRFEVLPLLYTASIKNTAFKVQLQIIHPLLTTWQSILKHFIAWLENFTQLFMKSLSELIYLRQTLNLNKVLNYISIDTIATPSRYKLQFQILYWSVMNIVSFTMKFSVYWRFTLLDKWN